MQSFQLIYGGRVSDIRVKLPTSDEPTGKHGFIDGDLSNWHKPIVFTQIGAWYQTINDEQTQRPNPRCRAATSASPSVGFADWAALLAKLNEYRQTVKIPFDELVSDRKQSDEQLQVDHQRDLSELEQN